MSANGEVTGPVIIAEQFPVLDTTLEFANESVRQQQAREAAERFIRSVTWYNEQQETQRVAEVQHMCWREWSDVATIMQPTWDWPTLENSDGDYYFRQPGQAISVDFQSSGGTEPVLLELAYQLTKEEALSVAIPLVAMDKIENGAMLGAMLSAFVRSRGRAGDAFQAMEDEIAMRSDMRRVAARAQAVAVPEAINYRVSTRAAEDQQLVILSGRASADVVTKYDLVDYDAALRRLQSEPGGWQRYVDCRCPKDLLELFKPDLDAAQAELDKQREVEAEVLNVIRGSAAYRESYNAIAERAQTRPRRVA